MQGFSGKAFVKALKKLKKLYPKQKVNLSAVPAAVPPQANPFYRQQTGDPPPIQRCAAGGDLTPSEGVAEWPPSAAGDCRVPGWDKRGQDTKYGFLSPLDSPYLPSSRDALRLRG